MSHNELRLKILIERQETLSSYGVRNLEMSIRFSLKSRPYERFHRPEMYQIKAEISLRTGCFTTKCNL